MRLWAAYVFKIKWHNIVGGSNTVAYLLCQWRSGLRSEKKFKAVYAKSTLGKISHAQL